EDARRPLAARDRARQPRDPAAGGDGGVPRPAVQPRGRGRRARHRDPLLRDPRLALPDPDAELLGRPQLAAAGLALDRERGGEARAAARALSAELAAALRTLRRKL